MWCIWIKQGNTWIQSTQQWSEESEAREAAGRVKTWFSLDQVFIQYSDDPVEEIQWAPNSAYES